MSTEALLSEKPRESLLKKIEFFRADIEKFRRQLEQATGEETKKILQNIVAINRHKLSNAEYILEMFDIGARKVDAGLLDAYMAKITISCCDNRTPNAIVETKDGFKFLAHVPEHLMVGSREFTRAVGRHVEVCFKGESRRELPGISTRTYERDHRADVYLSKNEMIPAYREV